MSPVSSTTTTNLSSSSTSLSSDPGRAVVLQRIATVRVLSDQFRTSLSIAANDETVTLETNPCTALSDAASVMKAQTTKLGLLLITKPLTPSAIGNILEDLEKRVLTSFFGFATYICSRLDVYGTTFVAEVKSAALGVLNSIEPVLEDVEQAMNGAILEKDHVMLNVGKVYSANDGIIDLARIGVTGFLYKKVKAFTALMMDAHEELVDWREDMDDETNEDGDSEDEDAQSDKERSEAIEELVSALSISDPNKLPGHREDLIILLAEGLRRIELISMLCTAIAKRRVRKFPFKTPPFSSKDEEKTKIQDMKNLNKLLTGIENMQSQVDEVAGAFYDLSKERVMEHLKTLSNDSIELAQKMSPTWDGEQDEFSGWAANWIELISRNALLPAN